MSPITTHVLDTARGGPAAGVPIRLEVQEAGAWRELAAGVTNSDGRVHGLLPEGGLEARTYRMSFETGVYFTSLGLKGFYPYAQIVFEIHEPEEHYHVPLLLSPFGYSTYRGS